MTLLYLSLPRILSILKTLHQLSERLAGKWLAQFNFAQLPLNEETLAKMPIGLAQQLHMIKPERKAPSDIGWLSLSRIFRFRELGNATLYGIYFNKKH